MQHSLNSHEDHDHIMVVIPSDHYIPDEHKFIEMINNAIKCMDKNDIITFGIETRPETGYGYIDINKKSLKIKYIE